LKNNLDIVEVKEDKMKTFFAGSSHVDITPKLGHNLAGWIDVRPASRQATPILARAVALSLEQTCVLMINCDIVGFGMDLHQRMLDAVAQRGNIDRENIFILPTHNHYGPSVSGNYAGDAKLSTQEAEYTEALIENLAIAARAALDSLRPARLSIGYGEETTYSQNDRFWRKDGTINWVGDRPTHLDHDSGPKDPQVSMVHIVDAQNESIATLFNFACHANCAEPDGFTAISWDYPGYTAQIIEQAWGGEALFLPGTCGNIHPMREGVAQEMGEAIGRVVIEAAKTSEFIEPDMIEVRHQEITLPARDFSSFDPQQIEMICSQIADKETSGKVQSIFMSVLNNLKSNPIPDHLRKNHVIVLGDLAIVFVPGELFAEFGMEIKKRSPFKHTLVVELLSESVGYVPTRKAYQEGGYQPAVGTRLAPGGGELIVEKALALLAKTES
jgi:neutral ceramidase